MSNVLRLPVERHDLQALVDEIKDLLHSKSGLNFTEALGALELVKLELYLEAQHEPR